MLKYSSLQVTLWPSLITGSSSSFYSATILAVTGSSRSLIKWQSIVFGLSIIARKSSPSRCNVSCFLINPSSSTYLTENVIELNRLNRAQFTTSFVANLLLGSSQLSRVNSISSLIVI